VATTNQTKIATGRHVTEKNLQQQIMNGETEKPVTDAVWHRNLTIVIIWHPAMITYTGSGKFRKYKAQLDSHLADKL
jgi:hypothetical protein